MAKVSKNARTDRKVQEGSKDNVKVIYAYKKGKGYRFGEVVMHKDKVAGFLEEKSENNL